MLKKIFERKCIYFDIEFHCLRIVVRVISKIVNWNLYINEIVLLFYNSRYGRVQNIKILKSSGIKPISNTQGGISASGNETGTTINDQHGSDKSGNAVLDSTHDGCNLSGNTNPVSSNSSNSNSSNNCASVDGVLQSSVSSGGTITSSNGPFGSSVPQSQISNVFGSGTVCATIAFMDIKSASKAHQAEHKYDDRILTTEYYEPSSFLNTNSNNNEIYSSPHHELTNNSASAGSSLPSTTVMSGSCSSNNNTGQSSNLSSASTQQYSALATGGGNVGGSGGNGSSTPQSMLSSRFQSMSHDR